MKFYRFVSGNLGIYEAVDLDCPRGHARRKGKPDGSWLPKVGDSFPGAISFWTVFGLRKYLDSGLSKWHASIVTKPVEILVAGEPTKVLYRDAFQVICKPNDIQVSETMPWDSFSKNTKALLREGDA